MSLEIDLPPSVVASSVVPASRPPLRLVEPPVERRARTFVPSSSALAAFFAIAVAAAVACAVTLARRRRSDPPRSTASADVAAARAALALEERRRALEDRPVVRFVDDLAPALAAGVAAPVASLLRGTAVRASLGGGGAAGAHSRRPASTGDVRAVAWAGASILSLGIAMLVLTGAFAAPSILGATVPTAVGIGALLRYAMLSTGPTSRRDDRRPRPR